MNSHMERPRLAPLLHGREHATPRNTMEKPTFWIESKKCWMIVFSFAWRNRPSFLRIKFIGTTLPRSTMRRSISSSPYPFSSLRHCQYMTYKCSAISYIAKRAKQAHKMQEHTNSEKLTNCTPNRHRRVVQNSFGNASGHFDAVVGRVRIK